MIEYLLPPTVGAFIGYFTNYLAIKMLFKPTRPYYLLGKKVPLTPGLIPAKREKLAEAIGKVVKENLLTEEVLLKRLNEEEVKKSLESLVSSFLKEISQNLELYVEELLQKVDDKPLKQLIPPELVLQKEEQLTEELLKKLHGRRIKELLPPSLQKELEKFLDAKVEELAEQLIKEVKRPEFRELIETIIRENAQKAKALFPLIPDNLIETVAERGSLLLTELIEKNANNPQFRAKVSKTLWIKLQELLQKEVNLKNPTAEKLKELTTDFLKGKTQELFNRKLKELPKVRQLVREEFSLAAKEFLKKNGDEIAKVAAEKLLKVIEKELPVIMASLDVENMVKERVNALPIEEVEEIVLKLIKEELKYITLVGAVLGALIGAVQIIL